MIDGERVVEKLIESFDKYLDISSFVIAFFMLLYIKFVIKNSDISDNNKSTVNFFILFLIFNLFVNSDILLHFINFFK